MGVKSQGGLRFCQEGSEFVSSTVISSSSNVRKVGSFSSWKSSFPRLLFLFTSSDCHCPITLNLIEETRVLELAFYPTR